MKKIVDLCGMMLLNMNMMAQIDPNDGNWECFINEDFTGNRYWDYHWEDQKDVVGYEPLWRCFAYSRWMSGVTGAIRERHAYQPHNTVFGTDQTLKLIGELKSQSSLWCGSGYLAAPWHKYCHGCDQIQDQHPYIHYHSGMIESINPVGYGYYEIKCKMPVHDGACSAFWFWSDLGNTYNEIDVFEHSTKLCSSDLYTETLSGIWYNPDGTNLLPSNGNSGAHRYASHHHFLPEDVPTLDEYHTFGCLWLPEKVTFFVDSVAVNEFDDSTLIPPHPMWIKVTHLEDADAYVGFYNNSDTIWGDWDDEMTISYVKGYRLHTDCDADITIRTLSDFNNFVYSTKHTITMGGLASPLTIPSTSCFTMRAVESIIIDGSFVLPVGAQMTLMTHQCPQCSMENVELPSYDCGMDTTKDE